MNNITFDKYNLPPENPEIYRIALLVEQLYKMNIGIGLDYKERYDGYEYILIVAIDGCDGAVVGSLTLRLPEINNEPPEIMWLAVEDNARYRRRGIATQLTKLALATIVSTGHKGEVAVCPLLRSEEAVAYWRALGFCENPDSKLRSMCTVYTKDVD